MKNTITSAANEARRYICDEDEMQIRPATAAEIVEFDRDDEGWIFADGIRAYVDGTALVGRDALGRVAIWASQQNKLVDARFCSWRDVQIALASIGGRSNRTVDRGGKIEQVPAIDDFAAYLEAVGQ